MVHYFTMQSKISGDLRCSFLNRFRVSMILALLFGVSLVSFASPIQRTWASGSDDQFGMNYSSSWVPTNTQGIRVSYSMSTSHLSCKSSSGWIAVVDTLQVKSNATHEAVLQAEAGLYCTGSGSSQWQLRYEYWDNNGVHHNESIFYNLSTSTYPSLTGYVDILYTGSQWQLQIYVSQIAYGRRGELSNDTPGNLCGSCQPRLDKR